MKCSDSTIIVHESDFLRRTKIPAMLWKHRARLLRGWIKRILLLRWNVDCRQQYTVSNTMHLRPEPCRNMGCIGQIGDRIDHFISSFWRRTWRVHASTITLSQMYQLWEKLHNTNGAWYKSHKNGLMYAKSHRQFHGITTNVFDMYWDLKLLLIQNKCVRA